MDFEEKPVLNRADLMDRLDGDHELAAELAELFISDVRDTLVSLQAAAEGGFTSEVERAAHSLKGAAANLSGERVRHVAAAVETAGKNNDMAAAAAAIKKLDPAVAELIDALNTQIITAGRR
ncbi:MAG: Hpt domain-containing protein [Desulfosalsimonadaceae bacterium]